MRISRIIFLLLVVFTVITAVTRLVEAAVTMSSYGAAWLDNHQQVLVRWETATEVNNAGFRLYRGDTSSFTPTVQNRLATIISQNGGSPIGAAYVYTDTPPAFQTYYYILQAIDVNAATEDYGPFPALDATPTATPTTPAASATTTPRATRAVTARRRARARPQEEQGRCDAWDTSASILAGSPRNRKQAGASGAIPRADREVRDGLSRGGTRIEKQKQSGRVALTGPGSGCWAATGSRSDTRRWPSDRDRSSCRRPAMASPEESGAAPMPGFRPFHARA